jgi:hypothetical protein
MRAIRKVTVPATLSMSVAALAFAGASSLLVGCGSSNNGVFANQPTDPNTVTGPNNGDGGINLAEAGTFDPDALAAADPPNQWCGPDGGAPPSAPPVGGTPACPSDKNLEGCPCSTPGQTAACWPGLRKNRNVGDCKDGTTTCGPFGEVGDQWGPCVGAVLPDPNATDGPAACGCFSVGQWHIDNLVPFFYQFTDGVTIGVSTTQDPDGGAAVYPVPSQSTPEPPPLPSANWSTDELTVDCAGTFTLCFELKGGDFNHPSASDCSIAKVCLPQTYYANANVSQPFPPLSAWEATAAQSTCAATFHQNGGYGEMSVVGESVLCQHIDDGHGNSFVFHRIQYCPASNTSCGQDGTGSFK